MTHFLILKSKSSLRDKPVDPSLDHVSVLFLGVDDSTSRREGGQKANQSRTDAMIYTTFNRDKNKYVWLVFHVIH